MAEYGSSGIWVDKEHGLFRHGMIDYTDLHLPQELAERFTHWIAHYEQQITSPSEYNYQTFNAEGRLLAEALKRHVGSETYVEFQAETSDGGLTPSEEIL